MRTVEPGMEAMLETFIHETETMLAQLDEILLESEREKSLSNDHINDIFRITHTIKGSAAMMEFDGISTLSHAVEDVFYVLRSAPEKLLLVFNTLFDLMLATSDALGVELEKIQEEDEYVDSKNPELIGRLGKLADQLKNSKDAGKNVSDLEIVEKSAGTMPEMIEGLTYVRVFFDDNCQMEHMRAFMLMTQLQHHCDYLESIPANPESDSECCEQLIKDGFLIIFQPNISVEDVLKRIEDALNIKSYELLEAEIYVAPTHEKAAINLETEKTTDVAAATGSVTGKTPTKSGAVKQSLISVNQRKLDQLMDLVGELVTAESMVVRNPDLKDLRLDNFTKSIRELRKLTSELQDIVMSIRMVPLSGTFLKMERIVRDMNKKLGKQARLVTEGGETEVDKTINDAIVDPFMHMIRNAMDHAIESPEERLALGKPEMGTIVLSAHNIGGEILINLSDDGKGLNPDGILAKAKQKGLLTKPESEYSEREIFSLILLAGFSTNTEVTEYSGRGVGLDVVCKNIEMVGGTISIASEQGKGTTFTIKIPLTLAIVDGMNLSVGGTEFTLPITAITQLFKISDASQIIQGVDGAEMIMIRGECFPIIRLHEFFQIETEVRNILDGIIIQIENSDGGACIFADNLLGEYQVVVKPLPNFFNNQVLKEQGISGCSILGDGSISLILDTNSLLKHT